VITEERVRILAEYVAARIPVGIVLGLGSGTTAVAVVQALARRKAQEPTFTFTGVATSVSTATLATSLGFQVCDLSDVDSIDLGFDGADEIDPHLNVVKGKGAALLYEKLVACVCRDYWIVSTDEKVVDKLGTRMPLPVEVIPYGWVHTAKRLKALGLAPKLRALDGVPVKTDAGNVILDCGHDPGVEIIAIHSQIKATTGVVEHGIFPGLAKRAIVVDQYGQLRTLTKSDLPQPNSFA